MFGETSASLKPGRRVEAEIRFVGQNEARCSLPEIGGLDAILSSGDISSTGIVNPSDYLKVGQTVPARCAALSNCTRNDALSQQNFVWKRHITCLLFMSSLSCCVGEGTLCTFQNCSDGSDRR